MSRVLARRFLKREQVDEARDLVPTATGAAVLRSPSQRAKKGARGSVEGETSSSSGTVSRDVEHLCGVAARYFFLIFARQMGELSVHVFLRLESNGANMWEVGTPQDAIRPD